MRAVPNWMLELRNEWVNQMLVHCDLEMTPIDENHADEYHAEVDRRRKVVRKKLQSPDMQLNQSFGCDHVHFRAWKVIEFGHGAIYLFHFYDSEDGEGEYHIGKAVFRGTS